MLGPIEATEDIPPGAYWRAIGCRAAAAAIVMVRGADGPAGFLALSTTHLTAAPPTITLSLDRKTSAGPDLLSSKAFAINYLAIEGRALFDQFTDSVGPKGAARFEGLDLSSLATGAPVLPFITGVLDCRLEEVIERFGVYLIIGKIVAFENFKSRLPLVHYQGRVLA